MNRNWTEVPTTKKVKSLHLNNLKTRNAHTQDYSHTVCSSRKDLDQRASLPSVHQWANSFSFAWMTESRYSQVYSCCNIIPAYYIGWYIIKVGIQQKSDIKLFLPIDLWYDNGYNLVHHMQRRKAQDDLILIRNISNRYYESNILFYLICTTIILLSGVHQPNVM